MAVSVFDLFSVGIGPSSSHTVGPMRAALLFATELQSLGALPATHDVHIDLYGSLAATGLGHATDRAVILGLLGEKPDTVDPPGIQATLDKVEQDGSLCVLGEHRVAFSQQDAITMHRRDTLPLHPNGMKFTARSAAGALLLTKTYYSIGGGFVIDEDSHGPDRVVAQGPDVPFPFRTGNELLDVCASAAMSIAQVVMANEVAVRPENEVRERLLRIADVMSDCINTGIGTKGILPGGLGVRRRAPEVARQLRREQNNSDQLSGMDWLTLYALAVSEQNAAGGRIVTAPTNGAAGVIPAVLEYYKTYVPGASDEGVVTFLLTAGGIGSIYLETASVSGAEVGCQGEIGAACSMAAAGYASVLGGTPLQVENAAEIGMEHNLGLTCDPVGGLVQVPCIERNASAAVQAVNAARTALLGDGRHIVSLDKVIKTMRETGADMKDKYKETSRGGLAVNVIEC